ncbi:protein kinase superfamily protein [Actinidia rufa]|uniref:Protein kinase superfamily protein n=1 Tax=Actinidia rufa TaxID=165716 RepID=A0A7J0F5J6_9ERIC|nr:protein kinase superfamily protein [Actinidia rufa]
MDEIDQFLGPNYALTWQNGLLLQNCTSPPTHDCVIPTTMIEAQFGLLGCSNIRCYSPTDGDKNLTFMSPVGWRAMNCGRSGGGAGVVVGRRVRVCSNHADCRKVTTPNSGSGFRCQCQEGFEGDGFARGHGCRKRKVHDCSASKYMSGKCGGRMRVGVLIGGIIAGALLMAALSAICYFIRQRSSSLRNRLCAKRLLLEAAGNASVPFYPYKEIERATNSFAAKQRLGTGAYGTVYAGKLHNDEWVAIKKIRHRDTDGNEQVMNEIKLLSSVSHPNLVRLLGCCIENGEQILVYEYMPNGTLSQHLQRERGTGLPWTIRLTIATETAHAIAYLHSARNPPIYHRDIKSSNILLDYNYNSKVADFGLSRLGMTDDSHISTAPQGTPGYVDPQYHQNFHLSDKSDVYSFGVVLVEIITALKVVDFSRPHSEVNLAALAIDRIGKGHVDEILDPFVDPHRDAWTLSSVYKVAELAFRCLAFHRDMRPSMMEVADELEQVRLSGWAPMDENICVALSVASSCSSPYNGSEKSFGGMSIKKGGVGSRRLIVPQRAADCMTPLEEMKDSSPGSVRTLG